MMTMERERAAGRRPSGGELGALEEAIERVGMENQEGHSKLLAKLDGLAQTLAARPAAHGGGGGAGEMLEQASQRINAQTHNLDAVGITLSNYVASGRLRREQNRRLWQVGGGGVGIGIVVGLGLLLGLARFLPYGIDTGLAAMVVGEGRWSAAAAMMADADFERYVLGYGAEEMARRNSAVLEPCVEAALASGAAQACTLRVLAPGQYYQQGLERPGDDAAP